MKPNAKFFSLVLASGFLMQGCVAPTGDWNEDSFGFDPRLADQRIREKERELANERRGLGNEQGETARLQGEREKARNSRVERQAQLVKVNADLKAAEKELVRLKQTLPTVPPESPEKKELLNRKASLENEIRQLRILHTTLLDSV